MDSLRLTARSEQYRQSCKCPASLLKMDSPTPFACKFMFGYRSRPPCTCIPDWAVEYELMLCRVLVVLGQFPAKFHKVDAILRGKGILGGSVQESKVLPVVSPLRGHGKPLGRKSHPAKNCTTTLLGPTPQVG